MTGGKDAMEPESALSEIDTTRRTRTRMYEALPGCSLLGGYFL